MAQDQSEVLVPTGLPLLNVHTKQGYYATQDSGGQPNNIRFLHQVLGFAFIHD